MYMFRPPHRRIGTVNNVDQKAPKLVFLMEHQLPIPPRRREWLAYPMTWDPLIRSAMATFRVPVCKKVSVLNLYVLRSGTGLLRRGVPQ